MFTKFLRKFNLLIIGILLLVAAVLVFPNSNTSSGENTINSYKGIDIVPDKAKDAIPVLSDPLYEDVDGELTWINDEDIVIGIVVNGDARAYPTKIMNWHEGVNEDIGGREVLVTYCAICRSAVVYDRTVDGQVLDFGNTGAVYESSAVFYDVQTGSYWWQSNGESIRGSLAGSQLAQLPSRYTTWGEWKKAHENTLVMSVETGFSRDYLIDPYSSYADNINSGTGFPVSTTDDRLSNKELVLGLNLNGKTKAYPISQLINRTSDNFAGIEIEIIKDKSGVGAQVFQVNDGSRLLLSTSTSFWFAWVSANPDSSVFSK